MNNQLVISALFNGRSNLIAQITRTLADLKCNITKTQLANFESDSALMMSVEGKWDAIAKFENALNALAEKYDAQIQIKRTETYEYDTPCLLYSVNVTAIDNPGIAHKVINYFAERRIPIDKVSIDTQFAPPCNTPVGTIKLDLHIPLETKIGDLRDDFLVYCDGLNVDGIFEAESA